MIVKRSTEMEQAIAVAVLNWTKPQTHISRETTAVPTIVIIVLPVIRPKALPVLSESPVRFRMTTVDDRAFMPFFALLTNGTQRVTLGRVVKAALKPFNTTEPFTLFNTLTSNYGRWVEARCTIPLLALILRDKLDVNRQLCLDRLWILLTMLLMATRFIRCLTSLIIGVVIKLHPLTTRIILLTGALIRMETGLPCTIRPIPEIEGEATTPPNGNIFRRWLLLLTMHMQQTLLSPLVRRCTLPRYLGTS